MTDKEWMEQARYEGEEPKKNRLKFVFLLRGVAVATDGARMHLVKRPEQLAGFFALPRAGAPLTKEEFRRVVGEPPDIEKVLDAVPQGREIDINLWTGSGNLEHFESGTVIDERFFGQIVGGEPENWKCFASDDPCDPVTFRSVDGARHAILMPIGVQP